MAAGEVTTGRPLPEVSTGTRPFWEAVEQKRLVIQHCDACTRWIHPPLPICPGCGLGDPGWRQVSGDGAVSAFTVVHRPPLPVFEAPYVIALVELADAGVRLLSNVIDCDPSTVDVGTRVRTVFRDVDGRTLYFFAPVGGGPA
ncbi:Zn-ribbon domain-containing OB-fold protein [Actinophytocola sp.]|uniref:Zn-ribbon domain-containing OB-fold protein n=1 Tax=Actinophytocola sp. TaxID=1872138 RepID=UPI003D6A7B95